MHGMYLLPSASQVYLREEVVLVVCRLPRGQSYRVSFDFYHGSCTQMLLFLILLGKHQMVPDMGCSQTYGTLKPRSFLDGNIFQAFPALLWVCLSLRPLPKHADHRFQELGALHSEVG